MSAPFRTPPARRETCLAALQALDVRRRHAVALESLCERKRRAHEEAVRQYDAAIEALEVELEELGEYGP